MARRIPSHSPPNIVTGIATTFGNYCTTTIVHNNEQRYFPSRKTNSNRPATMEMQLEREGKGDPYLKCTVRDLQLGLERLTRQKKTLTSKNTSNHVTDPQVRQTYSTSLTRATTSGSSSAPNLRFKNAVCTEETHPSGTNCHLQ